MKVNHGAGTFSPTSYTSASNGRGLLIYDSSDIDGDFMLDEWELREVNSILDADPNRDQEGDGWTAFQEFLFNGSLLIGDGAATTPNYNSVSGKLKVAFDGLASSGFNYVAKVSDDLETWKTSNVFPVKGSTIDNLFSNWEVDIDPTADGFSPNGPFFIRIEGSLVAP